MSPLGAQLAPSQVSFLSTSRLLRAHQMQQEVVKEVVLVQEGFFLRKAVGRGSVESWPVGATSSVEVRCEIGSVAE